jgi:hypothetical protein
MRNASRVRKIVLATVGTLALALVGFFVWQHTRPFPLGVPTDRTLIELFKAHRQTFQMLVEMADKDATIASSNMSDSLPVPRRAEYSRLLSQIDRRITIGFGPERIAFWCAGGGILSIGPRWGKGIAYLTAVPNRVGQIVHNLDKDPGHDDVYLVPIEGDWYVIYQRTDYDDSWKPLRSD